MRIIGYIEHPGMKITVFKTDTRISVKFETGFYEQTYKFPIDVHLQNLDDVKNSLIRRLSRPCARKWSACTGYPSRLLPGGRLKRA